MKFKTKSWYDRHTGGTGHYTFQPAQTTWSFSCQDQTGPPSPIGHWSSWLHLPDSLYAFQVSVLHWWALLLVINFSHCVIHNMLSNFRHTRCLWKGYLWYEYLEPKRNSEFTWGWNLISEALNHPSSRLWRWVLAGAVHTGPVEHVHVEKFLKLNLVSLLCCPHCILIY